MDFVYKNVCVSKQGTLVVLTTKTGGLLGAARGKNDQELRTNAMAKIDSFDSSIQKIIQKAAK